MEYLLLGMGKSNVSVAKFFEKKKIKYCWWDDYNSEKLVNTYPFLKDKEKVIYAFLEKIEREKREFFFKEKESWVKKGLKRQKNGI